MNFGKVVMQKKKRQNALPEGSERQIFQQSVPRQLALPFTYHPKFVSSDFISAPSNAVARTWLGIHHTTYLKPDWPERRLALWGEAGTGKTHLLQIWAEREQALYLPGSALVQVSSTYWTEKLRKQEVRAFVIDDADLEVNPQALLHLLNFAMERSLSVVLSGRSPPSRWAIQLPDLDSRLRAITTVKIEQPEEELLRILFLRLLAERQLVVSPFITEWLLLRLPRTALAIRETVQRLDQATLATGYGITRTLAMQVLEDLLDNYDQNSVQLKSDYGLFTEFE